jgi:hypothetical protein
MNPLIQSKNTTILPVLIALMLSCLTNENTVLGEDALLNNSGFNNTANGFNALYSNTGGRLQHG